jgi:hypothetical protein
VVKAAGAITDTRKYRAVVCVLSGSAYLLRSEPSTETAAQGLVAQQASNSAPGAAPAAEAYTSWELQGATVLDNYATWWVLGTAGAAVAIVDNSTSLFGLTPAPELGLHEPPISVKYLQPDDNRLLMAGSYQNTTDAVQQSRVWFTPVLGDLDIGDDQRIPDTVSGQTNWVDVDAGDDGGEITGFGPGTLGDVLVFKRAQLWRLIRTGNVAAPYIPRPINKSVGTFGYRTVKAGEDAQGQPCVYFAGQRGPYRVGVGGVEYLGHTVEDVWSRVNQFSSLHYSQHAVYYPDKGQYWLFVSVDGGTVPTVLLVYTVASGGWATYTGMIATATASALLPRAIQEPNKGVTIPLGGPHPAETAAWVPYVATNTNGQIAECDAINPNTGVALDTDLETWSSGSSTWIDGTTYAASITTAPLAKHVAGRLTVTEGALFADAASGVSVSVGLIPDYDTARTRTASVSLTAEGSGTRILKRIDGCQYAGAKAMQATVGDAAAVASQWTVHALELRLRLEADR